VGITDTINRAELATIAAAITHGCTHISTDSLSSLHQIKIHLLYPELHRYHAHYYCIIGNECADVIANYQAIQDKNNAETVVPNAETEGDPFYNSSWLAFEEINTSTRSLNPPAPRLKHFSSL